MSNRNLLTAMKYKDRENAFITTAEIIEPYEENSDTVISVGSTLKGDIENPTWKVHVPIYMVNEMIKALQSLDYDNKE